MVTRSPTSNARNLQNGSIRSQIQVVEAASCLPTQPASRPVVQQTSKCPRSPARGENVINLVTRGGVRPAGEERVGREGGRATGGIPVLSGCIQPNLSLDAPPFATRDFLATRKPRSSVAIPQSSLRTEKTRSSSQVTSYDWERQRKNLHHTSKVSRGYVLMMMHGGQTITFSHREPRL